MPPWSAAWRGWTSFTWWLLLAVLATGLARTWWGMKGMGWYWQQPLLHLKLTLFVVIGLISIQPTLAFRRWVKQVDADGTLPDASECVGCVAWS